MAQNVFPGDVYEYDPAFEDDIEVEEHENNAYVFDFKTGDFAADSSGRTPMGDAEDALIQWCVKAIATEKNCFEAYSESFGASLEEKVGMSREEIQAEMSFEVKEALTSDPLERVDDVTDFSFDFSTDSVIMAFTIVAGSFSKRLSIKV